MAITVSNVFIQSYETIVRHLAQQSTTKLRPWVMERGVNSAQHNWETLGKGDASQKTTARQATPTNDSPWARRVSVAQTWDDGDTTEQEDQVKALVDLNSNIARKQAMAMRRAQDDVIIAAATGTALDGDGNNVAFPAGQIVGDYSTEISFDLVTQVNEIFQQNDIDPEEPKVFVVGPKQVRKLMQLTEVTSYDYNQLRELNGTGMITKWMGMDWIMSTRLNIPAADQRDCFAMTRQALGLQVNEDITARIAEDPSLSFAWRIYCFQTLGAVRVEDEHLVWFRAKDTVT